MYLKKTKIQVFFLSFWACEALEDIFVILVKEAPNNYQSGSWLQKS